MEPVASVSRRQEPEAKTDDQERTCDFCSKTFSKPANLQRHLESNRKCSPKYNDQIENDRKRQKASYDKALTKWRQDDVLAGYVTELLSCDFIK